MEIANDRCESQVCLVLNLPMDLLSVNSLNCADLRHEADSS